MDFDTNNFCSYIYNYYLEKIGEKNYQEFSSQNNPNGLFFKSCYLYDEYIAFIYFIDEYNFVLQILSLVKISDNKYDFECIKFYNDPCILVSHEITLNEFLKIDNDRLVLISTSDFQPVLNILLFDFYDDYAYI